MRIRRHYYPTFDLNWNVEAKVETLKQFKSKSYPNTETGSSDPELPTDSVVLVLFTASELLA
jgi:hypothetical protein